MIIHLDEIKDRGISRQYLLTPHDLPNAVVWERSGDFKLNEPVKVEVALTRVGGLVEVEGRFATRAETSCGRCLKDFSLDLNESFELTFTNEPLTVHDEGADEEDGVELSAEELGLISFVGESIDLTEAIAEQLFLALPVRPLCSEECKGLCPHCGVDLNEKECHCVPLDFSNKFAALKGIKIN